MDFFDDELDSAEIIEGLLPAFPLRVRVGAFEKQYGRTGGEVAGGTFVPLSGGPGCAYVSIPATKSGTGLRRQEVQLESGQTGVVGLVWTLLGSWPLIKEKMLLQVVDGVTGDVIGQTHEVLVADVHDFGIHTEVRTRGA